MALIHLISAILSVTILGLPASVAKSQVKMVGPCPSALVKISDSLRGRSTSEPTWLASIVENSQFEPISSDEDISPQHTIMSSIRTSNFLVEKPTQIFRDAALITDTVTTGGGCPIAPALSLLVYLTAGSSGSASPSESRATGLVRLYDYMDEPNKPTVLLAENIALIGIEEGTSLPVAAGVALRLEKADCTWSDLAVIPNDSLQQISGGCTNLRFFELLQINSELNIGSLQWHFDTKTPDKIFSWLSLTNSQGRSLAWRGVIND